MGRKKLLEFYRIKEGQFDDINKSLGSAQSVAADPRAKSGQQKPSSDPRVAKAQGSLGKSKSIFDEAEEPPIPVNLTKKELIKIATWADEYSFQPGGREFLKKIEDAIGGPADDTGGMSSMSSTRSVGSVGMK